MAEEESLLEHYEEGDPFWPHHVLDQLIFMFVVFGLLLVLALYFPAHLGPKADPFVTPKGIKPEWYFLFIYQALKYVPGKVPIFKEGERAAVVAMGLLGLVVFFYPFVERSRDRHPFKRKASVAVGLMLIAAAIVLTVLALLPEKIPVATTLPATGASVP